MRVQATPGHTQTSVGGSPDEGSMQRVTEDEHSEYHCGLRTTCILTESSLLYIALTRKETSHSCGNYSQVDPCSAGGVDCNGSCSVGPTSSLQE